MEAGTGVRALKAKLSPDSWTGPYKDIAADLALTAHRPDLGKSARVRPHISAGFDVFSV